MALGVLVVLAHLQLEEDSMRLIYLCFFILGLLACNQQTPRVAEAEAPKKDVRDFTLPKEVTEAAPRMQEDLYRLLPFNSSRFVLKREFVFIDMDQEIMGPTHTHVTHMNMLHVCWWRDNGVYWSGSLMIGEGRNWMGFSKRGYRLKLKAEDQTYHFTLAEGDMKVETSFPMGESKGQWVDFEKGRLYVHHQVFPKNLTAKKSLAPYRTDTESSVETK